MFKEINDEGSSTFISTKGTMEKIADESHQTKVVSKICYSQLPKSPSTRNEINEVMEDVKASTISNSLLKLLDDSVKPSECFSAIIAGDKAGFFINVLPYSHLFDPFKSQFHRFQMVKVWVPPNCYIIFNSRLLHGGCRTRYDNNGNLMMDHRVFAYIIPLHFKEGSSNFPDHREVFPPEDAHTCAYLNGRQGHCQVCHVRGFSRENYYTIDPSLLYDNNMKSINKELPVGNVIFGDLQKMGFSIVKGPKVTVPLRKRIYDLKNMFKSQHSGLTMQPGRCMVVSPSELSNSLVEEEKKMNKKKLFSMFLDEVLETCHPVIDNNKLYQYYKPNIMFNRSEEPLDQKVHYDYHYNEESEEELVEEPDKVNREKCSGHKFNNDKDRSLAIDIEITKKKRYQSLITENITKVTKNSKKKHGKGKNKRNLDK